MNKNMDYGFMLDKTKLLKIPFLIGYATLSMEGRLKSDLQSL